MLIFHFKPDDTAVYINSHHTDGKKFMEILKTNVKYFPFGVPAPSGTVAVEK